MLKSAPKERSATAIVGESIWDVPGERTPKSPNVPASSNNGTSGSLHRPDTIGGQAWNRCRRDDTQLGLPNIGNTCYMNATLQCLFGLHHFINEIRRPGVWRPELGSHLFKSLSDVHSARASGNMHHKAELLRTFKMAVANGFGDFSGDEQQDAHEFLSVLLSQLKEEWESLKRRGALDAHACPVESNFDFRLQVTRTCCRCGAQVFRTEVYSHLSLDIVPQGTLLDSLRHYFKPTQVECRCERCPGQQASVSVKLLSLPRVLVIQLKRFSMDSSWNLTKLENRTQIPQELALNLHCVQNIEAPHEVDRTAGDSIGPLDGLSEEEQIKLAIELSLKGSAPPPAVHDQGRMGQGEKTGAQDHRYTVKSILSHLGQSTTCGHYVSDSADGDSWLTFDDRTVRRSSQENVLQLREKSAYLLFYVYR
ncbi:ubiquitin carboxyl-terminal hydrolase 37-like [Megalops cyprinoides]|uniref:ubiquitin carboxyl-terminal hydrolase 37-like n=1 Tax=Megalops cyprinoides TaxID=118141 RepID=UPI001863B1E9|nr:ubiquitin carboxyl-terminal hydrolase 37-like [Megalops cyprinoides]